MTDPVNILAADVARAREAIERAAEIRAGLRRRFPADRDEQLRAALDELGEAERPLRAHVDGLPKVGRDPSDPARLASRDVSAERRRVRKMLRRESGGPQARERISPAALLGAVRQAKGEAATIARGLAGMDSKPRPRDFQEVIQAREAGAEFARLARAARDRVLRAERRVDRNAARRRREVDALAELGDEAYTLRRELTALARRADRYARAKARRGRWEAGGARAAVDAFWAEHGRPPTRRELDERDDLPSYATTYRQLGGVRGLAA